MSSETIEILSESIKLLSMDDREGSRTLPDLICMQGFDHIYENIFSRLDTKSLCKAALVSTSWNDFIGSSTTIMQRITLCIDCAKENQGSNEADFDLFENSTRNYASLKIEKFMKPQPKLVTILEQYQWKRIVLDCQFVQFPTLSHSCVKNLSTLEITTLELGFVINLLKSSINLKKLKLLIAFCSSFDWEKISLDELFHLKSLRICLNSFMSYGSRRFTSFLNTQVCRLTQLDLEGIVFDKETLQTVIDMSNLRSLVLRKVFFEVSAEDMNGKKLQSLKTLKILDRSYGAYLWFRPILMLAPNIIYLEVNELNQQRIEFAGHLLTQLEELHAESIEFTNISDPKLFPEMMLIKIENRIRRQYQDTIAQQVEEELTNFKLCLYEEISKKPHITV